MIKRFNPDFSLSISHELAYMRETPEGGYVAQGDYATLFSELEVVKAERDALERQLLMSEAKCKGYFSDAAAALVRCDALAVERDDARNALASIYKTATGELPEWSNWHAYLDDIVEEVDAKLAALQAQGVEKALAVVSACRENICPGGLSENRQYEESIVQPHLDGIADELENLIIELREAK
ncbi:TPA: hypothetical protein ACGQSM_003702 [Serratia liquefaciens]